MRTMLNRLLPVLLGLALSPVVNAIEFDEVRDYEDVFRISGSAPARDRVEVRWDIEPGYYLYNNRFLQFRAASEGVMLGEPQVPQGKISFDELLGEEVEKYHDTLRVVVPLESVPPGLDSVRLEVRSQGCLEDELCYPPTQQMLAIALPSAAAAGPETSGQDFLRELTGDASAFSSLRGKAEKPNRPDGNCARLHRFSMLTKPERPSLRVANFSQSIAIGNNGKAILL